MYVFEKESRTECAQAAWNVKNIVFVLHYEDKTIKLMFGLKIGWFLSFRVSGFILRWKQEFSISSQPGDFHLISPHLILSLCGDPAASHAVRPIFLSTLLEMDSGWCILSLLNNTLWSWKNSSVRDQEQISINVGVRWWDVNDVRVDTSIIKWIYWNLLERLK